MSETPIGEIVGRHDGASASSTSETGATTGASEVVKPAAGGTQAGGQATETAEDPIAGLKSALDKERDRASRFEKDWKVSSREQKKLAQQLESMNREIQTLRSSATQRDPKAEQDKFYGGPTDFVVDQVSAAKQEIFKALMVERAEASKELARDRYDDFDDVEAAFLEAAAKDASLWNGLDQSRQPALLVYKRGKQLLAGAENAPESRIAKLEAEIAQLRAGRDGGQTDAAAETATATVQKPSVPRSNAGLRGSGVGKTTSWAGPTPIENVFGRRRSAR